MALAWHFCGLAVGAVLGCGLDDGAGVGAAVGLTLGTGLGSLVGCGALVGSGAAVGWAVGAGLGSLVGSGTGCAVGCGLGCAVGSLVGCGLGPGSGSTASLTSNPATLDTRSEPSLPPSRRIQWVPWVVNCGRFTCTLKSPPVVGTVIEVWSALSSRPESWAGSLESAPLPSSSLRATNPPSARGAKPVPLTVITEPDLTVCGSTVKVPSPAVLVGIEPAA